MQNSTTNKNTNSSFDFYMSGKNGKMRFFMVASFVVCGSAMSAEEQQKEVMKQILEQGLHFFMDDEGILGHTGYEEYTKHQQEHWCKKWREDCKDGQKKLSELLHTVDYAHTAAKTEKQSNGNKGLGFPLIHKDKDTGKESVHLFVKVTAAADTDMEIKAYKKLLPGFEQHFRENPDSMHVPMLLLKNVKPTKDKEFLIQIMAAAPNKRRPHDLPEGTKQAVHDYVISKLGVGHKVVIQDHGTYRGYKGVVVWYAGAVARAASNLLGKDDADRRYRVKLTHNAKGTPLEDAMQIEEYYFGARHLNKSLTFDIKGLSVRGNDWIRVWESGMMAEHQFLNAIDHHPLLSSEEAAQEMLDVLVRDIQYVIEKGYTDFSALITIDTDGKWYISLIDLTKFWPEIPAFKMVKYRASQSVKPPADAAFRLVSFLGEHTAPSIFKQEILSSDDHPEILRRPKSNSDESITSTGSSSSSTYEEEKVEGKKLMGMLFHKTWTELQAKKHSNADIAATWINRVDNHCQGDRPYGFVLDGKNLSGIAYFANQFYTDFKKKLTPIQRGWHSGACGLRNPGREILPQDEGTIQILDRLMILALGHPEFLDVM